MDGWPVITVKAVVENVALKQVSDLNPVLHQLNEYIFEQKVEGHRVLVLNDVLYNLAEANHLVVLQCNVECRFHDIVRSINSPRHLEEDRKVQLQVRLFDLSQQLLEYDAVKRKDGDEVRLEQLEVGCCEDVWTRLDADYLIDFLIADASKQALDDDGVSQVHLVEVDLVDLIEESVALLVNLLLSDRHNYVVLPFFGPRDQYHV